METDARGTVADDSPAPAMVGLVGDRAIEPIATDYAAVVDSAGVPGSAPAIEQSRSPGVQRHATGGGQVPGTPVSRPRVLATTAVQRSVSASAHPAAQWPPAALAETRSGVDQQVSPIQPVQFTQFVATAPAVTQSPLQLSTELVVQRVSTEPAAGTATETTAATEPAAGTGTGGTPPATPTGSSSPTEVDNLVRRLYEPIVRRLKAELQLDRERAGRFLDLWH
jgi:hypothetical protein